MEGYELTATMVTLRGVGGYEPKLVASLTSSFSKYFKKSEGWRDTNPMAGGIRTQGDSGDSKAGGKAGAKPRTGGIRTQGVVTLWRMVSGGIRTQSDCGDSKGRWRDTNPN